MKFTVVIPCYNVAAYLRDTLDSVLAQTHLDWECICVDDGSTDDTGKILDEYVQKVENPQRGDLTKFKVIHKENEGVSEARNAAIRAATGDYVCFIDGDDVWSPDWLSKMCEASDGGRADIIRMSFKFWRDSSGNGKPDVSAESVVSYINGSDSILEWGWTTYTTDGYIWLNAVKRLLLIDNHVLFPVGMKINEDIVFDLSLLPFAKCVAQSSYAGYFYRMRQTSAWHSKRSIDGCTRYLQESIRMWNEYRDRLERFGSLQKVCGNITHMFSCAVIQWLDFGKKEERGRVDEIVTLMREADGLGMLNLSALPIFWRPAYRLMLSTGSFALIKVTWWWLSVYHAIHRKLLTMTNR